jgi:hypothetical protein
VRTTIACSLSRVNLTRGTQSRVADYRARFRVTYKIARWSGAIFDKINQDTLAEMVGTTRSRIDFFMNKFRKLGFIHYNGGLKVYGSLARVLEE